MEGCEFSGVWATVISQSLVLRSRFHPEQTGFCDSMAYLSTFSISSCAALVQSLHNHLNLQLTAAACCWT